MFGEHGLLHPETATGNLKLLPARAAAYLLKRRLGRSSLKRSSVGRTQSLVVAGSGLAEAGVFGEHGLPHPETATGSLKLSPARAVAYVIKRRMCRSSLKKDLRWTHAVTGSSRQRDG